MAWEWQVWRSFDDIGEILEEKGWGSSGFIGHYGGGGMPPLLGACGDHCIVFFKRDAGTGECWFELRDKVRRRMVFVLGTQNIPTPERAAKLLADHGGPLYEIKPLGDRSMYGLPIAPATSFG